MKKIILNKYVFLLALVVGLIGCEDDIKYIENSSRTFNETPVICIDHINPKPVTNEEYTNEELAALPYNPCEKVLFYSTYDITVNDLDLVFTTNVKPISVEVQDPATRQTIAQITNIVEEDGQFKATYTSSFANLGIESFGDKVGLEFVAVYDLNEPTGDLLLMREPFAVEYKIYVDPNAVTPYVFLKKSTGETEGLATFGDGNITNIQDNIFVGKELTFDGIDDQIEIVNVPELAFRYTEDYSVGLWVKTDKTSPSDPQIFGDKDWNGGANKGITIAQTGDTWRVVLGDGVNRVNFNTIATFNDGEWHFLSVTVDRGNNIGKVYQDGVEIQSADISSIGDMDSPYPIRLSQDGDANYAHWYEGNIGEVYIYDYVLTPEQVANESTVRTGVQVRLQNGTVKNIPVTTSGGFDPTDEDGKFSFALDGIDDYATIDAGTDLDFAHTGDFTISYWIKTTATNSDPVIIGNREWEGGTHIGTLTAFTGGTWRAVTAATDASYNRVNINGIGTINDGEWHLLTITRDRDGLKSVYQDGILIETADISGVTGSLDSGNPWRIGQDASADYGLWFQGSIANCIFFDYAISDQEVLDLFTE